MKATVNGVRIIPTEEEEQAALFSWAEVMENRYPELRLMFHIPNGGLRSKTEAARFKRAGVKAGVPDICLPVARGGFHGLWIELKAMDGKLSENQLAWIGALIRQGYMAVKCRGFEEARETIEEYLGMEAGA